MRCPGIGIMHASRRIGRPGIRVRREDSINDNLNFQIVCHGTRPMMPWSGPAQVRWNVGLVPTMYDAELPHSFGRQCTRSVIAPVEVLAPVARYDVDVEISCKASLPGRQSNKMTYIESQPRGPARVHATVAHRTVLALSASAPQRIPVPTYHKPVVPARPHFVASMLTHHRNNIRTSHKLQREDDSDQTFDLSA
jgi:hypothetical protein